MCGKMVKGIPARLPRRSNSVPKLLADIGPPRSLVNTCGAASCSRCSRRRARISSPCIGCTDGVPFLLLRTCRRPAFSSIWCHCRSHSSEARSPWRDARSLPVAHWLIPSVRCASVADARADRARYAEIGPYRVCLVNLVLTFGGGNTVRKTGPNGSTNEGAFGNVADFNDHSCRLCRLCRGPFQKSHSG